MLVLFISEVLVLKNKGIVFNFTFIFIIFFILLLTSNIVFLYLNTKQTALNSIVNLSVQHANHFAEQIDTKSYERFLKNPTKNDDYWRVRNQLNALREIYGSMFLYTVGIDEDKKVRILIDGQPKGSNVTSPINELSIDTYKEVSPVLKGKYMSVPVKHDPKYGDFLSVFVPIKNEEGKIIGILALDVSAGTASAIATSALKNDFLLYLGLNIVLLILSIFFLIYIIKRHLSSLHHVNALVQSVSTGDLTISIPEKHKSHEAKNEIVQLLSVFSRMIDSLRMIINKTKSQSLTVSSSSSQLAASSEQLTDTNRRILSMIKTMNKGHHNQLTLTNESLHSTQGVLEGMTNIVEATRSVLDMSNQSAQEVDNGKQSIDNISKQMHLIQHAVKDSSNVVETLKNKSKEINHITEMITNIANQTNLLSLNAAIEAARAGEHGKGFAVVADEVKKLADQSAQFAKQINTIIESIQLDTEQAVYKMEIGREEVKKGNELVAETEHTFQLILETFENVSSSIQEVSSITETLTNQTTHVTSNIEDLKEIAQENQELAEAIYSISDEQQIATEEISQSAQALNEATTELNESIKQFKTN